eukprot:8701900-Pyramimonas_sp.AAC.1
MAILRGPTRPPAASSGEYWTLHLPRFWTKERVKKFKTRVEDCCSRKCASVQTLAQSRAAAGERVAGARGHRA